MAACSSTAPITQAYEGECAGCIMEQEVGYFGNDLKPSKTKETSNKQECADYSASTPGSLFWTWDMRTKKCFLKSSKAGRENHHNSVSGNSECGSGQCTQTQLAQAGTVAFAVDTTASMQKAIPIAQDAIVNLVNSGSHIPKWILTDFKANGYFNDSSGVRVVTDTQDPEQLKTDVTSLPIGGCGQEEVLLAIQRTLGVMPDNGVILVFTDEPTTQLDLESAVTAEATRKNVKVFFDLLGDPGQESEQVYERVSEGRVFRANSTAGTLDFDSKSFFDAIIYQVQHTSCVVATTPPAGTTDPGTTPGTTSPPAVTTDPGTTSPGQQCTQTQLAQAGTVAFAVDTTASMQKAIPIAQDAIVNLVNSGSHIPKWILTDFKANGYFNDSSGVRVVTDTQDPEQLKTDVTSLPIGGGGQVEVLLA